MDCERTPFARCHELTRRRKTKNYWRWFRQGFWGVDVCSLQQCIADHEWGNRNTSKWSPQSASREFHYYMVTSFLCGQSRACKGSSTNVQVPQNICYAMRCSIGVVPARKTAKKRIYLVALGTHNHGTRGSDRLSSSSEHISYMPNLETDPS